MVTVETSMGTIKVELFEDKAPVTVKNFLEYVKDKHYDGTDLPPGDRRLHDPGRRLRAGDDAEEDQGPDQERIEQWAVERAVAPSPWRGLPWPTAQRSQFFINVKDNTALDRANAADKVGYCVFGRVIEGKDVVDKIKGVQTGVKAGHRDVPNEDVVIKSVKVGVKG